MFLNTNLNDKLTINQLRYWNQAPTNLSVLEKNGINFSSSVKEQKRISKKYKKISKWTSQKAALDALTKFQQSL